MSALYVTCRRCHQEFRSGVFVSDESPDGLILRGLLHHCTWCGAPEWYFTDDYHRGVAEGIDGTKLAEGVARIGNSSPQYDTETLERTWPPSSRSTFGQRRAPLSLHP